MAQSYDINLFDLIDRFGSEDKCREALVSLRWPDKIACLECGSIDVTDLPNRALFQCSSCRYQFSVTAGTILHDSHLPLRKWFMAVYLIVEAKKSLSAAQLGRTIGVSYRTAWYLGHRIRKALTTEGALLHGIIEVDETYVGGDTKGKGRGHMGSKTLVVGARQRGGALRMDTGPNRSRKTLHQFIRENISDDAEAIYTDEWASYKGIADENTRHETVNHKAKEWVRGDVHTNTIESAWGLFKRAVVGSFHQISPKHLDLYLDEFEFRFNNRNNPAIFRSALRELVTCGPMEYATLTA